MLNKNSVQFKKSDDRKNFKRGFRTYPVPEVVDRGPLVWLGDEDPCKFCDAMDGKVDGEGWSSLRGPQWWKSGEGYWESLGKGRISGTPPIHPNCQCRLVSMAEWLEIRRKELQWVQRDEDPKEVNIPVGDWGPNDINYFKWQREEILKDLRAFRETKKLVVKEEKKKKRELERLAKKEAKGKQKRKVKGDGKKAGWVETLKDWGLSAGSFVLDAIPIVSSFKAAGEFITGVDSITGRKVSRIESGINFILGWTPASLFKAGGTIVVGGLIWVGKSAWKVAKKPLSRFTGKVMRRAGSLVDEAGGRISTQVDKYWFRLAVKREESKLKRLADDISLELEEGGRHGGHAFSLHVAKTDEELLSRGIEVATTFRTPAEANRFVGLTIKDNSKEIAEWLLTPGNTRMAFKSEFTEIVGRGIEQSTGREIFVKDVRIVLRKNPDGTFNIVTAYPKS